jgi:energy-coupling factor transporter transmembrane protein EcfT
VAAVSAQCVFGLLVVLYSVLLLKIVSKTKLHLLAVIVSLMMLEFISFAVYLWLSYNFLNYKAHQSPQDYNAIFVFESIAYASSGTTFWLYVSRYWHTSLRMKNFIHQKEES